jgi:hypothetical protein
VELPRSTSEVSPVTRPASCASFGEPNQTRTLASPRMGTEIMHPCLTPGLPRRQDYLPLPGSYFLVAVR